MAQALRMGMTGSDVKRLQRLLNVHRGSASPISEDGIFGHSTGEAVKDFQRRKHLPVDGIVGPRTWGELESSPSAATSGPASGGPPVLVVYAGKRVPFFTQFDKAWGLRKLGTSKTLSRAGCAITSIAMILKYYGRDMDPGKLDAYLDEHKGYIGDNVTWDVAFKAGEAPGKPKLNLTAFKFTESAKFAEVLNARIAKNWPTLAHVDYASDAGLGGDHWVVVVGRTGDGYFIINDPGTASGDGANNPNRTTTILGKSTRKKGLNLVRLCLFDVV